MEQIKVKIFDNYYNFYIEEFEKLNFNEAEKIGIILDIKIDKLFANTPKSLLKKYNEL